MVSLGVLIDRKARYIVAAVALLLAMILPTLVSADQITTRSVALSSSSVEAEDVTYQVKFNTVRAAGAFVVDFCSNSPLVGSDCTAPVGFDATAATSASSGFTDVSALDANTVVVAAATQIAAATAVTVDLENITNPDDAGTIYARIVTYGTDTAADAYTSTSLGTHVDDGAVAIAITDTTSVSGAVLETLQFCAAGGDDITGITANCANAADNAPVLRLGVDQGGVVALQTGTISEGNIYTQVSTNAASGAVVSLKSGNTCGGLKRVNATGCDIAAAATDPVTLNSSLFGMRIVAGTDPAGVGVATGAYQIHGGGTPYYNGTDLKFNYVSGGASGVTSTYGDQILNTAGAPATNKNMTLTFGATVNNSTPAGNYANDLSLIATGTF